VQDQWKKNVYLLWIAVFVASICWSMLMPFMPLFLRDELGAGHKAAAWAGVVGAVNSLGMAIMAPVWGAVGDRLGRKLMMLRAGYVLVLCYAAMAFVQTPVSLLGVRIAIGLLSGFIPTATMLVGTTTPQAHVGVALAMITTAAPAGNIIGPMLGGLLADLVGIRATMLVSSVLIGTATTFVLLFVKEQFTPIKKDAGTSLVRDLTEVASHPVLWPLLICSSLAMMASSTLEPIAVPYIKSLLGESAPNWVAGVLVSLPGVALVVAAPWWGARARKWGYGTTLTLGLIFGAVMVLPQAVALTAYDFGGLRLAQGFATASVGPGIASLIALMMPQAIRGRAYGINHSFNSIGWMIGPLIGGFLGTAFGAKYVFVVTGLLYVAAAVWARMVVAPKLKAAADYVA